MKASKLIKELQDCIDIFGDANVVIDPVKDTEYEVNGVYAANYDEKGEHTALTLNFATKPDLICIY